MTRLSYTLLIALGATLASCAPELNLEPAPDIRGELVAFNTPDAVVVEEIMRTVGDQLMDTRDDIKDSSLYEEILDVVVEVQENLYNEEGEIDLGGVTFDSPNGGVRVNFICDGWDDPPPEEPDPDNGRINLNMRLTGGAIAPLVWGSVEECRFPLQLGDTRVDAVYRGEIAVFFADGETIEGKALNSDEDPYTLEVYFLAEGSFDLGEELRVPIREFFSVTFSELDGQIYLDQLEILFELEDGTTFVYGVSFDAIGAISGQTIVDSTGELLCSLEERFCTSEESGTFSW
jgi:hypothetical protein